MPASDPYPVLCLLRSHLEAREARGEKRLWLTAEAREALREMVRMKPRPWPPERVAAVLRESAAGSAAGSGTGAGAAPPPAPAPDEERDGGRAESAPAAASASAGAGEGDGNENENEKGKDTRRMYPQSAAGEQAVVSEETALFQEASPDTAGPVPAEVPLSAASEPLTAAEKETRLAAVRARAQEGRAARALGTLRERMVFATGTAAADIVLVGEAPGVEEERQGEPFVGPAGQLLTRILKVMGLERGDVYISNICKYRPAMENQGSGNRQPTAAEMASCLEFVREEIRIIRPKVIVALGATASAGLLGIKTGVMSARGRFYEFEGIPAMVTLHPSYLLRREKDGPEVANAEKRKVWEDMLQVMERAGLPVSEKQRRFFLPR